jgi:hypothetical protein
MSMAVVLYFGLVVQASVQVTDVAGCNQNINAQRDAVMATWVAKGYDPRGIVMGCVPFGAVAIVKRSTI